MSRVTFFQEILSNIFDQSRKLTSERDDRKICAICDALLSESGEVSGTRLAAALLAKYQSLNGEKRIAFFHDLAERYDLDTGILVEAAKIYSKDRSAEKFSNLLEVAEPQRLELFRRINQVPGATEKLVCMREDLIAALAENPALGRVDEDFRRTFSAWFNRGFLVLKPIDWKTPANILEKIIEYEAVHAINDWDDLRRRLEPEDRRCFAFFHPAMPEEPLVFVEVALTRKIMTSIDDVLAETRNSISRDDVRTAVFYSISNCQKGLKGVSFGSFLIKQVVTQLSLELPRLKNFVTLSPVPGFARWFKAEHGEAVTEELQAINSFLETDGKILDEEAQQVTDLKKSIKAFAAQYFLEAKRLDGAPIDPVARFHLGNGASLHQINWMADRSSKGRAQSGGLMVNYLYDLDTIEANHEAFAHNLEVIAKREIKSLIKNLPVPQKPAA